MLYTAGGALCSLGDEGSARPAPLTGFGLFKNHHLGLALKLCLVTVACQASLGSCGRHLIAPQMIAASPPPRPVILFRRSLVPGRCGMPQASDPGMRECGDSSSSGVSFKLLFCFLPQAPDPQGLEVSPAESPLY